MSTEDKIREITEYFHSMRGVVKHHDKKQERFFNSVSHQELHTIVYIGENGASRMSDIADNLQLSLSSITGIVDKLVAKKMARRIRSTEDRRIVQVVLTDVADRLFKDAMNSHIDFVRDILNTLNSQEQDQLLALFKKIVAAMKDKRAGS
jgi:DNA-binding MarR family transcriptional regulator